MWTKVHFPNHLIRQIMVLNSFSYQLADIFALEFERKMPFRSKFFGLSNNNCKVAYTSCCHANFPTFLHASARMRVLWILICTFLSYHLITLLVCIKVAVILGMACFCKEMASLLLCDVELSFSTLLSSTLCQHQCVKATVYTQIFKLKFTIFLDYLKNADI